VDRDEDVIDQSGWELGPYIKAGAPVLWAHQTTQPPIARAESIAVQGGRLKAVTVFPEKDIYPFADTIYGLVKGGFIKGTSVGFHPIEAEQRKGAKKGVHFKRQELMEFSILPIPSNREALLEAKSAGYDVGMVVKWAEALLDEAEQSGLWVPRYQIEKAIKTILPLQVAVPAVPPSRQDVASEGHATAGAALSEDEAKGVLDILDDKAAEPEVFKYIRFKDGKWCVYSEDGKKLGEHETRPEAVAQLQAIEANKHKETEMEDAVVKVADFLFGETKAAPPWAVKKDEPAPGDAPAAAPAAPQDQKAQTPQPPQGDGKTPSTEGGKPQGGDPTEANKQSAPLYDQLAATLNAEIQPLTAGGDPTQIATALKAALEKFAASFMQTFAGAPNPNAQPPAAAAPAKPAQPPVPPPVPPPQPKSAGEEIVKAFESLTENELREIITTATKTSIADARKHLSGRLPD